MLHALALRGYKWREQYTATGASRKVLAIPPLLQTDIPYRQEQGQGEWFPGSHSGKSNRDWCLQRGGIKGIKINRGKQYQLYLYPASSLFFLNNPSTAGNSKETKGRSTTLKRWSVFVTSRGFKRGGKCMWDITAFYCFHFQEKHLRSMGQQKTPSGPHFRIQVACGHLCSVNRSISSCLGETEFLEMGIAPTGALGESTLWKGKWSLCPLSPQYVLYLLQPNQSSSLPTRTFSWHLASFKSRWQSLHLQKVTAGSLLYATLRVTSKSFIFTLLPS